MLQVFFVMMYVSASTTPQSAQRTVNGLHYSEAREVRGSGGGGGWLHRQPREPASLRAQSLAAASLDKTLRALVTPVTDPGAAQALVNDASATLEALVSVEQLVYVNPVHLPFDSDLASGGSLVSHRRTFVCMRACV